jgi:hypothetical protein
MKLKQHTHKRPGFRFPREERARLDKRGIFVQRERKDTYSMTKGSRTTRIEKYRGIYYVVFLDNVYGPYGHEGFSTLEEAIKSSSKFVDAIPAGVY